MFYNNKYSRTAPHFGEQFVKRREDSSLARETRCGIRVSVG